MKRKMIVMLLALAMLLGLAACSTSDTGETSEENSTGISDTQETETSTEEDGETSENGADASPAATGTQTVVIIGQDWGPAVTKTILTLNQAVAADSVTTDAFEVQETKTTFNWDVYSDDTAEPYILAEAARTVTAAYTCDAEGNQVSDASSNIALELYYSPSEGSPYIYDGFTFMNSLCPTYELAITLTDSSVLAAGDGTLITDLTVDAAVDLTTALVPQLEDVDLTGSYTGSDGHTLTYASYEPEADGEKHPLVIWLHGQGEGGTDPSVSLLGNKVTALLEDEFQSIMGGAYVLTPQTPIYWLCYTEDGEWDTNPGTDSIYLSTLMELIENYVAEHEDIDADRIYVGGCSNGGYMTMDLVLNNPDYFAAAFPICEAYLDSGITDEQLEAIKDLPIWFVYAENDTTVLPDIYEIPTIARLQAIDADIHTSIFEDVHDTSGLYTNEDGSPYEYMGHWSWLYFFNNECEEDGVGLWDWLADQSR